MSTASSRPSSCADLGIALLRMSLGVMWIAHALLKVFVFTLPGTAKFFESVGFIGALAYPVFVASIALWLAGDGAFALKRSERFVPAS
jgi:putative oxidoreductase